jgi:dihydroxyacetone kinase-like protein
MLVYVGQQIISNQDYLNKADQPIGDGDHGLSMARGFEAVIEMLKNRCPENLAELFLSIGNELLYSVGGSAGIIFGTFLRSGSKAFIDKQELDSTGLADFLQYALDAIIKRGNAKPGEKSMIDALFPAVTKAKEMDKNDFKNTLNNIADAAFSGMENTKSMKANIGRAKNFGDSTIGYPDPGAITTYLILRFMSDFVNTLQSNWE